MKIGRSLFRLKSYGGLRNQWNISILFTGLVLAILFVAAGFLFLPIWYSWTVYDTSKNFYKEPRNSIEVIFLGTSVMAAGGDPMIMYESENISAYNLGAEQQPMLASYY